MGKNNRPHVYLKVSEESETGKKLQSRVEIPTLSRWLAWLAV